MQKIINYILINSFLFINLLILKNKENLTLILILITFLIFPIKILLILIRAILIYIKLGFFLYNEF